MLGSRRAAVTLGWAVSLALSARFLGPEDFGQLATALAIYQVALVASDFGFSLYLGRELAPAPADRGHLLRAAVALQSLWALCLAGVIAGVGVLIGLETVRGSVLLILAPAIALSGLGAVRQAFYALYRTGTMALVDIPVSLVQSAAVVLIAALGGGAHGIAIAITVSTAANYLLLAIVVSRLVEARRPHPVHYWTLLRGTLPLGVSGFLTAAYTMGDVILLGWLVSAAEVGQYAVAARVFMLLVTIPNLVCTAALPGLAVVAKQPDQLSRLAARLWHWLTAIGLPASVGTAVFADPLISVVFGPEYQQAAGVLRILALASVFALMVNVLGTCMVALGMIRTLLVFSAGALAFNVTGNLLLVPVYGIYASAWLTLAGEVLVSLIALLIVRRRLSIRRAGLASARTILASLGLAAVGLGLSAWPMIAFPLALTTFVLLVLALQAWPVELRLARTSPVN
jgi:O-antigen/teichoic acid export membrane protein